MARKNQKLTAPARCEVAPGPEMRTRLGESEMDRWYGYQVAVSMLQDETCGLTENSLSLEDQVALWGLICRATSRADFEQAESRGILTVFAEAFADAYEGSQGRRDETAAEAEAA